MSEKMREPKSEKISEPKSEKMREPKSEKIIQIKGMTCASCVNTVEKALNSIPGVKSASVNLATERARIESSDAIPDSVIQEAVRNSGYEAVMSGLLDPMKRAKDEGREVLLSAGLTLPLMHFFQLPFIIQLFLASCVQFGFGMKFYQNAYSAIRNRSGNMDLLIAIGTTSAFILSFVGHHSYFESAASIITLVKLGKWLELRAKAKTSENLRALESLKPTLARVKFGNQEFEMPISGVKVSDHLIVLPGERIPLDGEVIEGESEVDESFLTGESRLVYKQPKDSVLGGSINTIGRLEMSVRALGADTLLSRVIRLIEEANSKKAPIQKLVDQVAAVFVPSVLGIAILVIVIYGWVHGRIEEEAWIRAISVLVIACPCALGLATPTAMMVGTGLAAKSGILIRDPEALQRIHSMNGIALDKTGTLTEGRPTLKAITQAGGDTRSRREVLAIAGAIQKGSEHPLAKAILESAKKEGVDIFPGLEHRAIPGVGIEAKVQNRRFALGSERMLSTLHIPAIQSGSDGGSRSYLIDLEEKQAIAVFDFEDRIKARAREFIEELKRMHLRVLILSGDREAAVKAVAEELRVSDYRGNLLPEDKAKAIEAFKAQGLRVGMLGDGVNDAPALAAADIGIAFSSGTDVANETAGITLMGSDPMCAIDAIRISARTYSKIKQNLIWAFLYNVVCIPLAAMGKLDPMLAGAAMALSSVSVVTNSLLLRSIKTHGPRDSRTKVPSPAAL